MFVQNEYQALYQSVGTRWNACYDQTYESLGVVVLRACAGLEF